MKSYQYYIFDLDGTLIDSSDAILSCIKEIEIIEDLKRLDNESLNKFIGPPLKEMFQKYYQVNEKQSLRMIKLYCLLYRRIGFKKTKPLSGSLELLKELKKQKLNIAIASFKQHELAKIVLDYYDYSKYLDYISLNYQDNIYYKKDLILNCLAYFNCVDLSQVVFVGDTTSDAYAALGLQIDFIGIKSGEFKDNRILKNIKYVDCFNSPKDMYEEIKNNY